MSQVGILADYSSTETRSWLQSVADYLVTIGHEVSWMSPTPSRRNSYSVWDVRVNYGDQLDTLKKWHKEQQVIFTGVTDLYKELKAEPWQREFAIFTPDRMKDRHWEFLRFCTGILCGSSATAAEFLRESPMFNPIVLQWIPDVATANMASEPSILVYADSYTMRTQASTIFNVISMLLDDEPIRVTLWLDEYSSKRLRCPQLNQYGDRVTIVSGPSEDVRHDLYLSHQAIYYAGVSSLQLYLTEMLLSGTPVIAPNCVQTAELYADIPEVLLKGETTVLWPDIHSMSPNLDVLREIVHGMFHIRARFSRLRAMAAEVRSKLLSKQSESRELLSSLISPRLEEAIGDNVWTRKI